MLERRVAGMHQVLTEIVGKELLRSQAVQVTLMKKGVFTDEELKVNVEEIIESSKKDLKEAAEKAEQDKQKAVEILIPSTANVEPKNEQPQPTE